MGVEGPYLHLMYQSVEEFLALPQTKQMLNEG